MPIQKLLRPQPLNERAGFHPSNGAYTWAWGDEFDACVDGRPDPQKWTFERGWKRNNEAQWYQPENAVCADGMLQIIAEHHPASTRRNPFYPPPYHPSDCFDELHPREAQPGWCVKHHRPYINYTSSSIMSKVETPLFFGQYDARIRLPVAEGTWPAWWFVGVDPARQWPLSGEVDVLEHYRGKLLTNVGYSAVSKCVKHCQATWKSKKVSTDTAWGSRFHVFSFRWTDQELAFFIDGGFHFAVSQASMSKEAQPANPFGGNVPIQMIFNLALGGDEGGDIQGLKFPQLVEVDYIRYFAEPVPSSSVPSMPQPKAQTPVPQGPPPLSSTPPPSRTPPPSPKAPPSRKLPASPLSPIPPISPPPPTPLIPPVQLTPPSFISALSRSGFPASALTPLSPRFHQPAPGWPSHLLLTPIPLSMGETASYRGPTMPPSWQPGQKHQPPPAFALSMRPSRPPPLQYYNSVASMVDPAGHLSMQLSDDFSKKSARPSAFAMTGTWGSTSTVFFFCASSVLVMTLVRRRGEWMRRATGPAVREYSLASAGGFVKLFAGDSGVGDDQFEDEVRSMVVDIDTPSRSQFA